MLVSVYIPTRNRKALLERALASVLAQDHTQIEVIVVDEASSDGTATLLSDFAKSDARVRILRNDVPMGAPFSRNRAISCAQGQFVTGLDDDDYFTPNRISSFLGQWYGHLSRGDNPACLYSQSVEVRAGLAVTSTKPAIANYQDLFVQNVIGNQVFAPKEHFIGAGLFDEEMPAWQDLDLFIRMLRRYGSAYLVDTPSYIYDDEDRGDRISSKGDRVRVACGIIGGKHPSLSANLKFALFMQMFNGYYDIRPSKGDLAVFVTGKPSRNHFSRFVKMAIKGHVLQRSRYTKKII